MSENTVTRDELVDVVTTAGLTIVEQSAYFKCTNGDRKDVRIYIAKSEKAVRVDLSGFTLKRDGITQISAEEAKDQRLGAVRGQLDFSCDNETVLEALAKACDALKAAPAKEKKAAAPKKVKPVAKVEGTVDGSPVVEDDIPVDDGAPVVTKEERRALIKAAAAKAREAAELAAQA